MRRVVSFKKNEMVNKMERNEKEWKHSLDTEVYSK